MMRFYWVVLCLLVAAAFALMSAYGVLTHELVRHRVAVNGVLR